MRENASSLQDGMQVASKSNSEGVGTRPSQQKFFARYWCVSQGPLRRSRVARELLGDMAAIPPSENSFEEREAKRTSGETAE